MIRTFFISIFIFCYQVTLLAQCPTSDFNVSPTVCLEEQLDIKNVSINAISYQWDFCADDNLEEIPVSKDYNLNFGSSVHSKTILANNKYYTFIPGWNDNSLYRLDFGNSITNEPVYTSLGNLNNEIENLAAIDLVLENGMWFGLGVGFSNNALYRFSFGLSLSNTPTVENISSSYTLVSPYDISIVKESGNYFALIVNYSGKSISKLSFGNSILNTPTENVISISSSINLSSLTISMECNKIYGFVCDRTTSKIFKLNFSNSISNTPIVEEVGVSSGLTFDNPGGVASAIDGTTYFLFVSSRNGDLYRLDFGAGFNNIPTGLNLGNINSASKDWGIEFIKENSIWYMHQANFLGKLFQYQFGTTCDVTFIESKTFEPTNINYTQSGNRVISLTTYNTDSSLSISTQSITISPSLAPQLSAQITGNCLSSPINFNGQQISGNITSWNWDFGDGSGTSNSQNDSYTYASAGEYQVKLNVTDANGCNNLLIDTVQVYEEPIPNFSYPAGNLCMNNAIAFTNTTTGEAGAAVTWTWDFNGEGSSNEKEPLFTFLTAGSKTITLTSSIPGCANVTQQTINIEEAPTSAFSFNNTCNSFTTTFTDESFGANLTAWQWNFGDGEISTNQNPTHTYANPGKYVVTLSVSNSLGCTTTKVDTVYNHDIPVVNFTNDFPCSTTPIQFNDQSFVANANLVAWEWNFGDGATSLDQHPTHLYNQDGDFTVKLSAYSQFGCVGVGQAVVTVAQGPSVDFEWDKACQGEATTFTDLTNSFGEPITTWNWIVDGQLLTSQHPSYTFASAGLYAVQLTVTLGNFCAQTITQDIHIEVPPSVQFNFDEGCGGAATTFYDLTDQTDDPIIAREWRADGSIFSTDSLATILLATGNYAITLSIITTAGCEETTTSNIFIIGSPIATFDVNTDYGSAPLDVSFINNSTGGNNYLWSFGDADGSTSTEKNPTFTFTEIGTYTVTLKTSSDPICFDETTLEIEVVEPATKATIIAITPIKNSDNTNFLLTIQNNGTTVLDSTTNLIFRADYGTKVIEPFNSIAYAGKTINYSSSYALPSNYSPSNICVELVLSNQLDKACISLAEPIQISAPYPNPSSGIISVDVILANKENIEIRVLNRLGQSVITHLIAGFIGINEIKFDGQRLPQGIYIIEINTGSKTEQFKTSIVR